MFFDESERLKNSCELDLAEAKIEPLLRMKSAIKNRLINKITARNINKQFNIFVNKSAENLIVPDRKFIADFVLL